MPIFKLTSLLIIFSFSGQLSFAQDSNPKFYDNFLVGFNFSYSSLASQPNFQSFSQEIYGGYRFKKKLTIFLTSANLTQIQTDTSLYQYDDFYGIGVKYRFLLNKNKESDISKCYIEPYFSYSGNKDTSDFHGSGNLGVQFSPYSFPYFNFGIGVRENFNSKYFTNLSWYIHIGFNITIGQAWGREN
ncbi:MAG: hypothetical protein KDC83_14770 [Flavobacteriales bacterium]|nr:hypothetical protein [Flavobacteriales bacterium]